MNNYSFFSSYFDCLLGTSLIPEWPANDLRVKGPNLDSTGLAEITKVQADIFF